MSLRWLGGDGHPCISEHNSHTSGTMEGKLTSEVYVKIFLRDRILMIQIQNVEVLTTPTHSWCGERSKLKTWIVLKNFMCVTDVCVTFLP